MQAEVNKPFKLKKPRNDRKEPALAIADWNAILAELESGTPLPVVAQAHGLKLAAIRKHATANAWPKHLTATTEPDTRTPPVFPGAPLSEGKKGRPTAFSESVANYICDGLAAGLTLTQICAPDEMPEPQIVASWRMRNPAFAEACARAKAEQADLMDEKILEECENATPETANLAKVRISAYQWRAARLKPHIYGDKIEVSGTSTVKIEAIRRVIVDSPHTGPECITRDNVPQLKQE